jgi:hypothetical protein
MAKRSRRSKKSSGVQAVKPVVQTERTVNSTTKRDVDFVSEYHYVYTDMRTMIFITLVMVAVVVGLSYII